MLIAVGELFCKHRYCCYYDIITTATTATTTIAIAVAIAVTIAIAVTVTIAIAIAASTDVNSSPIDRQRRDLN